MSLALVQPDPLAAITAAQSRIRLRRRGRARWYEIERDGKWEKVPGVTTVISVIDKPGLKHWAANLQFDADILTAWEAHDSGMRFPNVAAFDSWFRLNSPAKKAHVEALREACDHGKQVHKLIENFLREQLDLAVEPFQASDEALFTFSGFKEWAASVKLRPLMVEAVLASFVHGFAGMMDGIALVEIADGFTLLDWKTSKAVYGEHRIQNVAYRMQVKELTGVFPGGMLVRLPKDGGEIEPVALTGEEDDPEMLFDVFLHCLGMHSWAKKYGPLKRR